MTDNPEWLSTYGVLTAERILERFKIKLSKPDLLKTLHSPNSRYYHLLTMPLKNIFNGILVSQVHDYQVYVQKLLIDYLLAKKDMPKKKDQTGTHAESELAEKKEQIIYLGEIFDKNTEAHRQLISDSQAWLIQEAPTHDDLADAKALAAFGERAEEIMVMFKNLRTEFRTIILDVTTLLNLIPDYAIDEDKIAENQATLNFDADLGEEKGS